MKKPSFKWADSGWKKLARTKEGGAGLFTVLSLVEGEILTYLEENGVARLRKVVQELEWPMAEVMMAVGVLMRERLVEVRRDRFGVLVSAC